MGRVEQYRAELRRLTEWEPFLKKNSGLPGARANLELVGAVGDEADAERLWRLSASSDEFLALCGTAGLGHLAVSDPVPVMSWLQGCRLGDAGQPRQGAHRGDGAGLGRQVASQGTGAVAVRADDSSD